MELVLWSVAMALGASEPDYAAHVEGMKSRVPQGFTTVVEPPFVVVGDEARSKVERRATGTVAWAARELKESFFAHDPTEIWEIWLFAGRHSYEGHARSIFGDEPDTPYGYASSEHRALIMNIHTGGGTLVHEMVHPYLDANFPEVPPWFNEGLASLYEACAERDGRIVGLTNWRLSGLQRHIAAGTVPSFRDLMRQDAEAFYGEDAGVNYAQARYLCYWLQEKGLLREYYRQFKANVADDPTGYETLKAVAGIEDMAAFHTDWQVWAANLEFDG